MEEEQDAQAVVDIWKYVYGFVNTAVVRCAIELGIADALETHKRPMALLELSSTLGCDPSLLHRIMRFLTHQHVFKEEPTSHGVIAYTHTPLSRFLLRRGEKSLADLILLESSPSTLASWHGLSSRVLANGTSTQPAVSAHGAASGPACNELFNDAMASSTRITVPAILEGCGEVFNGLATLVDVGGGNGTALSLLVKACPWMRGINFDLPHVVSTAIECQGVQHVGGDMFKSVPKADAAFIMKVLRGRGDDECIQILKNCREAIPSDKGKVIIVDAVINENDNDNLEQVRLMLDMVMMAFTSKGKERTTKEWGYVLKEAGFSRYTFKPIPAVLSVIEAFP